MIYEVIWGPFTFSSFTGHGDGPRDYVWDTVTPWWCRFADREQKSSQFLVEQRGRGRHAQPQ